jgi:endonuclease/exonuclease/phosphatase family metal-dependent hydrolase
MKIISLNIEYDKHLDLVIPFIQKEQPDVLCLQELLEKDVAGIGESLGYECVSRMSSYADHPSYPLQRGHRQGVAVFAKKILASGGAHYLGSSTHIALPFEEYSAVVPNVENERALVWADIANEEGVHYRIVTAHLPVTERGAATAYQLQAAESLLEAVHSLGEVVLCGDMNAPRGQATFDLIKTKFTDCIPEKYTISIDCNIHRRGDLIRKDNASLMVDGLFLSPTYTASDVNLADGVSDHMAIVANIKKI